ncbi:MAG: hypothetical protein FWH02_06740 [Oscillospiraceae bacterium]|nr:hypothetical protein [Oscillospiraceae bacterium]
MDKDKNYNVDDIVDDILSEIKRKKSADKGAVPPAADTPAVPPMAAAEPPAGTPARKKDFALRLPEDSRSPPIPRTEGPRAFPEVAAGKPAKEKIPLGFSGDARPITEKARVRQGWPRIGRAVPAADKREFRFDPDAPDSADNRQPTRIVPKFATGKELLIEDIQRMDFREGQNAAAYYEEDNYAGEIPDSSRADFSEYNSAENRDDVATDIAHTKLWLFVRSGLTAILTFFAVFFALSERLNLPMPEAIWPVPETMQAFMIACTAVTVLVAVVNSSAVGGGLISFFKFRANADSLAAFAILAAILQCIAGVASPETVDAAALNFYFPVACLAMFFSTLGKMAMISRIQLNFRVLGSELEKKAVLPVEDPRFCQEFAGDNTQRKPAIAYGVSAGFFTEFLALSYSDKYDVGINRSVAPVCVIGAAVVGAATFLLTAQTFAALSAFTAVLCVSATFSAAFIENIPLYKMAKRVGAQGGMISGSKAVEDFCDAKAVVLSDTDLFGKGCLSLHGIKAFSQGRIDEAMLDAASVICALDGALAPLFLQMINNNRKVLKKADNIVLENGLGVSAWIDQRRVLIGSKRLMQMHGVTLPNDSYERGEAPDAKGVPVYLSNSGEVSARFLVEYTANEELAAELDRLSARGIRLIVATSDVNIDSAKIWETYGYPDELVSVLPPDYLTEYKKMSLPRKEAAAGIVYTGRAAAMIRAVLACIAARSSILSATVIELAQILLGYGLVTFLAFMGSIGELDILRLGMYQMFWFAAIFIVQQVRQAAA